MKLPAMMTLVLAAAAAAICPLNLPPEEACPESSPSCALYIDADGDARCDNPAPLTVEEELAETPPDTIETPMPEEPEAEPDTIPEPEPEPVPDPVEEDVPLPDPPDEPVEEDEPVPFCPLGFTPDQACPVESPSCALYTDGGEDDLCDNPGPQPEPPEIIEHEIEDVDVPVDTAFVPEWDSVLVDTLSTEITVDITGDSVVVDTVLTEEIGIPVRACPLNLTPSEACPEDSPRCTFYTDADLNLSCDNPGELVDTLSSVGIEVHQVVLPLDTLDGCPLNLPPAAACPTVGSSLCPHYMGGEGCINPSGGGMNRAAVVLLAIAVLLPVSTCLRRRLRGRRKVDRRKRKIAHVVVYIISIGILGFAVQGCYCPLGAMQYLFLPGGLGFLGGIGLIILILPMLWSLVYCRIFCGWVCPFGALQGLLARIGVPRPPKLPRRVHRYLVIQKYVLSLLFFLALFLAGRGTFGRIIPASLWCRVDPFHTIFSFFLVGSIAGGVALLVAAIFLPRFFCRYLCFYGAVLSVLGRVGMYPRLVRKNERSGKDPTCMKPG